MEKAFLYQHIRIAFVFKMHTFKYQVTNNMSTKDVAPEVARSN